MATTPHDSLIGRLPEGPLDIVGDVHGEWDALQQLLGHLGYNLQGQHPDGRTLVFVGDLCDRGPNTPAILDWALPLIANHTIYAVLGNHEINLIRADSKDGAGWAFADRIASDTPKYAPFAQASAEQVARYSAAIAQWPVALERTDVRVVHAAWVAPAIAQVRPFPLGSVCAQYDAFEDEAAAQAAAGPLQAQVAQERVQWPHSLEDGEKAPPLLPGHAQRELLKQTYNPLKILTTGVEQSTDTPFYAGGKWRFTERKGWWERYADDTPVVIGHYWRRFVQEPQPGETAKLGTTKAGDAGLFSRIPSTSWHGLKHNVFCVDFSVGARWMERLEGQIKPAQSKFHLAALRWPENQVVLETGETFATQ